MKALADPRIVRFERSPGAPSLFDAYDAKGALIWHSFDFAELAAADDRAEQADAAQRRADTDARLAASESTYLLQRAEKAESKLTEVFERTDAALANECKLHYAALDRAEQAEMERNQAEGRTRSLIDKLREITELGERLLSERNAARESGAEYIKRTDPLLACDSENFTCGECRACVIQQRDEARERLGNLLARIHRDGGDYQAQHGTEKAVADADALVVEMLQAREQLAAAVCVLDELDVRMNPKGGRIDSYGEYTYSDKAVAAFAKIAHLVKP